MCKTDPIRSSDDIQKLKQYFLEKDQIRNYTLITLGMNTSLRISDLLSLAWDDVYDFKREKYRAHIAITEGKTGKRTVIAVNDEVKHALETLRNSIPPVTGTDYIFKSRIGENQPIGRISAYKIIRDAVAELGMEGTISCHSLRKTFGYHAWKKGVPPALIMSIYNHSSIEITKRYLSIDQDDKDEVFLDMNL